MVVAHTRPLIVAAEPLTVTVDLADALGVGLSMQTQIRNRMVPPGAEPAYARIAAQLVSAARAAAAKVGR